MFCSREQFNSFYPFEGISLWRNLRVFYFSTFFSCFLFKLEENIPYAEYQLTQAVFLLGVHISRYYAIYKSMRSKVGCHICYNEHSNQITHKYP